MDYQYDLPARTSILVAAARAFGSREPDESVRNPDWLAHRLIGPAELALISEHPISQGLEQDYAEASQNPVVVGLAWLMLLRTRFIDEALEQAVKNGATQIVILGAGFDSRAYRFRELLQNCKVLEVDAPATQAYKERRIRAVLQDVPHNLKYSSVDFAHDDLCDVLRRAGISQAEKTFYVWEGVSMYLPEGSVRKVLQTIAAYSAAGSSLVLDYLNSVGIEYAKLHPHGPGGIPTAWEEPWIFGTPGADGREFFRELGLDPGVPLATTSPDAIKRYTTGSNGVTYGAAAFQKMRENARERALAEKSASPAQGAAEEVRKSIVAAGGAYWLAELTVPEMP